MQLYPAIILQDAPVAYLRLGELSGTTAADSSGNGNSGTYSGTYTQGQAGAIISSNNPATLFGGGMVRSAALVLNAPVATFEAWVYLAAYPSANAGVVQLSNGIGSGVGDHNLSVDSSGHPVWFIYDGSSKIITAASAISLNAWHYLAGTIGGGTQTLFVDGVSVGSQACGAAYAAYTVPNVFIGSDGVTPLTATIDEVAVYATALSATRVKAHYTAGIANLLAARVINGAVVVRAGRAA